MLNMQSPDSKPISLAIELLSTLSISAGLILRLTFGTKVSSASSTDALARILLTRYSKLTYQSKCIKYFKKLVTIFKLKSLDLLECIIHIFF